MVLEGHPWERGVRRGVMVLEKGGAGVACWDDPVYF